MAAQLRLMAMQLLQLLTAVRSLLQHPVRVLDRRIWFPF